MKANHPPHPPPEPRAPGTTRSALESSDPIDLFETVGKYVGFTHKDSRELVAFFPHVEPRLDEIVEEFYKKILADPGARAAIT